MKSENIITGIIFMMLSTASFSVMNIATRMLADDGMASPQIIFLRNITCVAILIIPFYIKWGSQIYKTDYKSLHLWRNLIGILGMECWFYALTQMPVNTATALSFTAPLFTAIIAVIFLKESIGKRRAIALLAGFAGVIIILRPSAETGIQPMALLVLFATILWATTSNLVKKLSALEPGFRIIFLMSVLMSIFSLPFAIPWWTEIPVSAWDKIILVALSSMGAHYFMVCAFARAGLVTLMPFDFTRLLFTAILAYIFLNENIDIFTAMGAAVIVSSCVYIAWREKRAKI